jgi:hypothetical protein
MFVPKSCNLMALQPALPVQPLRSITSPRKTRYCGLQSFSNVFPDGVATIQLGT